MQTRRFIRLTATLVLSTLALSACSDSGNKAGGSDAVKPRVLTLANPNGAPPAQMHSWAAEVDRLSGGKLAIEFRNAWRRGEPRYETGTLEDVRAGKADLGWVGARAFDTMGVESFQALLAPLLVDSYDLQARVFEEGIPERMLEGLGELELIGIGVLPGPMRKVLGISKPFVHPRDFADAVVGLQDSGVADATLRALGATPRIVPSGAPASLRGLDAYEQQLSAIDANGYDRNAKYVTANVNLWPRPLVVVMGKALFESLTEEERSVLRDAAVAALPEALVAARAEDDEATPTLCRRGLTFAVASASDLAALRTAFQPVYARLAADPATRSAMDEIGGLKTTLAAPAEVPRCDARAAPVAASPIPDGRYESTLTRQDWVDAGMPEGATGGTGTFTMVVEDGHVTLLEPGGNVGFDASYTVFRDQIEARASGVAGGDVVTARFVRDGDRITWTGVGLCIGAPCGSPEQGTPYAVVWEAHPWVRVEAR